MKSNDIMTDERRDEVLASRPAPTVTKDRINEVTVTGEYFRSGTLTLCVLTLQNGFKVVGESACASPENFDEELGRKLACQNAEQKVWALEGYLLRQSLWDAKKTKQVA